LSNDSHILKRFQEAIFDYDHTAAESLAHKALGEGTSAKRVARTLTDAMREIGDKFGAGEIYLPELVLASRAGTSAMAVIEDRLTGTSQEPEAAGTVVLGTVKGDVHDIGKNIVATLFFAAGFKVVNLGVDVAPETFIEAVREHEPDLLGLSALLTTTMTEQQVVLGQLEAAGLREKVKVLVGGAPVTEDFAVEIGADGYGENAFDAVRVGKELLEAAEVEASVA